ncbi:hypothetical protein K435DRAFT_783345 [Dendrothele bispora CBS 962.96]|uniref:Uncharacterized protein n=1 Tax=Dendrothele bispora (strain CBS 962.96) TaxID=1314807 RepID=A0A4S8LAW3_DENBC|nr:hypothetical protein K435DRAFT_783345 [Dendrothele bispora CBS 962.96]
MKGTYQGRVNDPVCSFLIDDCVNQVASRNVPLYSVNSCALSAACDGTFNLLQLATCAQPSFEGKVASQLPSLDYDIYAGIVGECAWAPGGCSMTRQNFIDWFYRSLDEMNTPVWPDVDTVINNWWMPIRSWTNTGDSVPYLNLNDWLHWST